MYTKPATYRIISMYLFEMGRPVNRTVIIQFIRSLLQMVISFLSPSTSLPLSYFISITRKKTKKGDIQSKRVKWWRTGDNLIQHNDSFIMHNTYIVCIVQGVSIDAVCGCGYTKSSVKFSKGRKKPEKI